MEGEFQDQGHLDKYLEEWLSPIDSQHDQSLFSEEEKKNIYIYTSASPTQRRNRKQVESLFETTNLPNIDQYSPDLVIHLPLGLLALTTS